MISLYHSIYIYLIIVVAIRLYNVAMLLFLYMHY